MSISPLPERWVCTSRSRDCIRPCTASSRRTSRATIRSGSRTSTAIGHHSRSTSSPSFCCRFSSATRQRCSSSSIASDSTSGARWSLCWLPISTSRRRTTTRYCRRRRPTRVTRCSVDCFRARSRRDFRIGGATPTARTNLSMLTSGNYWKRTSRSCPAGLRFATRKFPPPPTPTSWRDTWGPPSGLRASARSSSTSSIY